MLSINGLVTKFLPVFIGLMILASPSSDLFALGDGPCSMLMAPAGLNLFTPAYLDMSSNFNFAQDILVVGGDIKSDVVPVTYIRFFGIKKHFAQVWLTPTWGSIGGKIENNGITLEVPTISGLADPYVAMRIGLIGTPALSLDSFKVTPQKTFQLHFLLGFNAPLGSYSSNRPLNLGTNRWAIRLAAPAVLSLSKNPRRGTYLEMTPSLMLYTNNNDPFGGNIRKQAPMFILENHLSHNLTSNLWASCALRVQEGGQTETDGSKDGNKIRQLGGALTAGYSILPPPVFL